MKITVISDSHRNYHRLKSVIDRNMDSDLFIHLGDGMLEVMDIAKNQPELKIVFVRGNTDYLDYKEESTVDAAGYKIFCTHGHNYNVHWELDALIDRAREEGCKIALFGHTHIYRTERINDMYIMNPGSLDRPRGKNPASYGVINISEDGKVSMNIIAFKEK